MLLAVHFNERYYMSMCVYYIYIYIIYICTYVYIYIDTHTDRAMIGATRLYLRSFDRGRHEWLAAEVIITSIVKVSCGRAVLGTHTRFYIDVISVL